jgi:hypothetical protein
VELGRAELRRACKKKKKNKPLKRFTTFIVVSHCDWGLFVTPA